MNATQHAWPAGRTRPVPTFRELRETMAERRRRGEPADVETLLRPYPDLARDPILVRDLACEEFSQRLAAGETPNVDDFAARFPQVGSFQGLLVIREFFEDEGDLLDENDQSV